MKTNRNPSRCSKISKKWSAIYLYFGYHWWYLFTLIGLFFCFADEKLKQKKARFERFDRAPPIAALNGGRMTRTQEARIEEVKRKKKKRGGFKGSTFKGRKKTNKVQKGKTIQAAPIPTATKTKAKKPGNEPKATPEVQAKPNRDRNRNRTVVERVARESGRIKRSTAFYGLPSEMPEKTRQISGNGSDSDNEVHRIVQQIMDDMLEKVEKASQVLNEAEKMNLDLSSAKTEQKKRRSSTDSVSIQISNQSELVEEIVDLFKAPATTSGEVVGKEKKTEPIRIFENSRQIKARGGDQPNEKHLQ